MLRPGLTGSRIRERRIDLGIKQARLAELCGISASYLNLIEHNRRRIGGKLLNQIAEALDVEVSALSEGAEAGLLEALRSAAAELPSARVDPVRAEEVAGRFPDWARLISAQNRRIASLERTVETLNDRLTHDPFLSASLHDVLSTVTAIRSASAILAGEDKVDPEWQDRFHRNIHEDSQRLTEAAQALVAYLDSGGDVAAGTVSPQEEFEAWLEARDHHFPVLEAGSQVADDVVLAEAAELTSDASFSLARRFLGAYRQDAQKMPLADVLAALSEDDFDPGALAQRFHVDMASLFRRLANMPPGEGRPVFGLAICDGSGTILFRKQADGFTLPRFGAACPLLPLYQALQRPMSPLRAHVEQAGRTPRRFLTYAISQPAHPAGFDAPTVFEASMLVVQEDRAQADSGPVIPIGTSCRICPRQGCIARREPSILAESS